MIKEMVAAGMLSLCTEDSWDLWEVLDEVGKIAPELPVAEQRRLAREVALDLLQRGFLEAFRHLWTGPEIPVPKEEAEVLLQTDRNWDVPSDSSGDYLICLFASEEGMRHHFAKGPSPVGVPPSGGRP